MLSLMWGMLGREGDRPRTRKVTVPTPGRCARLTVLWSVTYTTQSRWWESCLVGSTSLIRSLGCICIHVRIKNEARSISTSLLPLSVNIWKWAWSPCIHLAHSITTLLTLSSDQVTMTTDYYTLFSTYVSKTMTTAPNSCCHTCSPKKTTSLTRDVRVLMLKVALVKVNTSKHWKSAITGMKVKCIHCLPHGRGRSQQHFEVMLAVVCCSNCCEVASLSQKLLHYWC